MPGEAGTAGIEDTGFGDTGIQDAGFGDTGIQDAGFGDTGIQDAGFGDAGFGDAGFGDAGIGNSGVQDAGVGDTVTAGAGIVDARIAGTGSGNIVAGVGDSIRTTLVLGALRELAPRCRAVLVLRHWAGFSVDATADMLGLADERVDAYEAAGLGALDYLLAGKDAAR